jgi:hypothetical protein
VHVVAEYPFGDADERVGIDPAAHAEGQGDVGAQAQADRGDQPLACAGDRVGVTHALINGQPWLPEAVQRLPAVGCDAQEMPGTNFRNAFEEGLVALV